MTRILSAAGLPKDVLEMVNDVVDTCKECKKWQRPTNETIVNALVSTAFNEHVEMALMYYKQHVLCHFIDRASRWHAATMIENKDDTTLVEALLTAWIQIHGPMKELIVDSESAVVSSQVFQNELLARGITLKTRTPEKHASYIERRGALLRQTLYAIEGQLQAEGIIVSFPMLLAETIFAGNCLTHVGGVTPYQVVYGRQPAIMPPVAMETENPDVEGPANDRIEARTREIALQAMIEATSQARVNRAMRTRTTLAGDVIFELGDIIEYHRPSSQKDVPGWHGPGVITEILADQGQAIVKHHGDELVCRTRDLRHFIGLGMVFLELQFGSTKEAFEVIRNYVENKISGSEPKYVDLLKGKPSKLLDALRFVMDNYFGNCPATAVRIGRGNRKVSHVDGFENSLVMYWTNAKAFEYHFAEFSGTQVDFRYLVGQNFSCVR